MSLAGGERSLPRTTATFLFTDVERHTELWEVDPDAMAVALAEHEDLITAAVLAVDGRVVKNEGDAMMAVFLDAAVAVEAARSAQLALHDVAWPVVGVLRVRMGLHTGMAYERDGDYFGPAVIRAARLCGAAHGQQILASAVVVSLAPTDWIDLGEHALRGLGSAERVHQLAGPGLRREFPPLRDVTPMQDRLPRPRTSFVGRVDELRAILRELEHHRVVTLTGVGGSGKTRLAIEAARAALPEWPDGADFVDLSVVTDENDVYAAVAAALGLQVMERGAESPESRVLAYLTRRRTLMVIDNCEHLLDAVAGLVDHLTGRCEFLRILATSREALRVEDERIIAVGPLEVASDAVALFRDRAADTTADPATVTRICERLDGIPLAIELAAARTTHLSADDLAARLDDRFRLLTGGRRRVQRQQTLQATLDWSYDLLTVEQRTLLRHLAVFAGPFRLASVEGICATAVFDTIDTLGALVDRSMVNHDPGHGRYRLLETVRLYAEQKLLDAGETAEARRRHCEWFRAYVCGLPFEETFFPGDIPRRLIVDLDDVRASVRWLIDAAEWEQAAELATRLATAELLVGSPAVEQWASELMPRLEPHSDLAFRCFLAGVWNGTGRRDGGLRDGARMGRGRGLERMSRLLRRLGLEAVGRDDDISIFARAFVAFLLDAIGRALGDEAAITTADELIEQAIAMVGHRPLSVWTGYALAYSAETGVSRGDVQDAAVLLERCAGSDIEPLRAAYEPLLAFVLHELGDTSAFEVAARALERNEMLPHASAAAACVVALELAGAGELPGARDQIRSAVPSLRLSARAAQTMLLIGAAGVAMSSGDHRTAARWLGCASAGGGLFSSPEGVLLYRRFVPLVRGALPREAGRALRDEGRALSIDDALGELEQWGA
jgi:predicted ATPase/class 3 adenylate cyclase